MTRKVSWGVLSTAKIGMEKVLPAMRRGTHSRIDAIASRDADTARAAADRLGIARSYGSYEALLADPDLEAVYNPLPNHLHVAWTIRAMDAGKHVLCEKPIALTAAEAEQLVAARARTGLLVAEAFMVRQHPQWILARDIATSGRIGEARAIQTFFTYHLTTQPTSATRPTSAVGECATSAATPSLPPATCSAPSRRGPSASSSETR